MWVWVWRGHGAAVPASSGWRRASSISSWLGRTHVCGMYPKAAEPKWVCIRKKLVQRFALSVRQLAFGNLFTFWYGLSARNESGSTYRGAARRKQCQRHSSGRAEGGDWGG